MEKLIFNTLEKYQDAEQVICDALGYPDGVTLRWSEPIQRNDGKYIMKPHPTIEVEYDAIEEYDPNWFDKGEE